MIVPWSALGCLHGTIMSSLLHLVKWYEASTSQIVLAEEFEALLCTCGGLDNNVIKHSAGSGNGNIILFINGGKISETSHDSTVR